MIRINLLPLRAERKKEDARRMVSTYVLAVGLVFILIAWSHLAGRHKVSRLSAELASNKAETVRYTKLAEQIKTLQGQKGALEAKLGVIQSLEKSKTGPVHLLDDLASRLPVQRLWLTGIEEKGTSLTLKGQALDNEAIANYMRQLGGSIYVKGVDLLGVEQREEKGAKLMEFTLTCSVSMTGAPEPAKPGAKPAQPGQPPQQPGQAGGPPQQPAVKVAQQ